MTEHRKLFFINNFLFFVLLADSLINGFNSWFTGSYFCLLIVGSLIFLVYKNSIIYKISTAESVGHPFNLKTTARAIAWTVVISISLIIGFGPVCNESSYSVDKFSRVIGIGLLHDHSISKISSHFYLSFILIFLLAINVYQNIRYALLNNIKNRILKLAKLSDTLLFVGLACLTVCIYRIFLSQNDFDLLLYLVKVFCLFLLPVFYLYETSRLQVRDIRTLASIALLAMVVSVNIIVYFSILKAELVFLIALSAGILIFILNRKWLKANERLLNARLAVFSLFGALSLIAFSVSVETVNILALRADRVINIQKISHVILSGLVSLSVCAACLAKRKTVGIRWKHLPDISVLLFVLGIALIQYQPSLVFGGDLNIYESGNMAVPVSDFFNFGKIPLFENFPGHGLEGVVSSIAYGALSGDYLGALFAPWRGWIYSSVFALVIFAFVRKISNSLTAFFSAVMLPYVMGSFFSWGLGLAVLIPFIQYFKTNRNKYLVLTVILSVLLIAYRLDLGFSYLAGILMSSLCVSLFYRNRMFIRLTAYYFAACYFVLIPFLCVCLINNVNPVSRVQEFLSIAASNTHWGGYTLGDSTKHTYLFFYVVMPIVSVLCLFIAIVKRLCFSIAEFATILVLIFAYQANIPRILTRHTIGELFSIYWIGFGMWTIPFALYLLLSKLIHRSSSVILSLIVFSLLVDVLCFQNTINYDNSVLQNAITRAARFHDEMSPDVRQAESKAVYSRRTRVTYNESGSEGMIYSSQIKAITDFLLVPDETYLDFTNQSAAYAWSGRRNPAYAAQPPSMLSGETSQRIFISELKNLNKVPVVIMPTDKSWYFTMHLDGINNNIRHYLVAEWIYSNYRPLIKYNDYSSVWVLNSRYDEFYNKLKMVQNGAGVIQIPSGTATSPQINFIDWGYDNFVSLPDGAVADAQYITMAHDYNVEFLPFIWGQFDSRNAAANADLTGVSQNGSTYTWNYSGKENKPAYIRLDLSVSPEFLKSTNASSFTLGNMEGGQFTPLSRFRFKLKEGKKIYLFRISSDYYWSRGELNVLVLDQNLGSSAKSVRLLEGD